MVTKINSLTELANSTESVIEITKENMIELLTPKDVHIRNSNNQSVDTVDQIEFNTLDGRKILVKVQNSYDDEFAIKAFALYFKRILQQNLDAFNLPKWYTEALSRVSQERKDELFTEVYKEDNK